MFKNLSIIAKLIVVTSSLSFTNALPESSPKYELRGIALGMSSEQVLAVAKTQNFIVAENSGNKPGPFKIIILQDAGVKHRAVGNDSNSGSGLALTIRVNSTSGKTVWIEAGQVGPGDLLQAAKSKFGPGRDSLTYPHSPSDSCMGYGSTNKRLGQNRHIWGDCRGPHIEFYSKDANTYSGIDVLLIVDPDGLTVQTNSAPVPKL